MEFDVLVTLVPTTTVQAARSALEKRLRDAQAFHGDLGWTLVSTVTTDIPTEQCQMVTDTFSRPARS